MKTRIPKTLAVMKWPNSWKKIIKPSTSTNAKALVSSSIVLLSSGARGVPLEHAGRLPPRPGVGVQHGFERGGRRAAPDFHDFENAVGDRRELHLLREEPLHRLLVGRVEHGRVGAAPPERAVGQ